MKQKIRELAKEVEYKRLYKGIPLKQAIKEAEKKLERWKKSNG